MMVVMQYKRSDLSRLEAVFSSFEGMAPATKDAPPVPFNLRPQARVAIARNLAILRPLCQVLRDAGKKAIEAQEAAEKTGDYSVKADDLIKTDAAEMVEATLRPLEIEWLQMEKNDASNHPISSILLSVLFEFELLKD